MISILRRDPATVLKSTPPRIARNFLDRERLKLSRIELAGRNATILLAPTGFGKTSQLIQWRREVLAQGGLAFWLSLDSRDTPLRLVQGLAQSAQASCGKRGFAEPFMRWIEKCSDPQEATTGWLAEVSMLAVDVVLLLDDTESLPTATHHQVLTYLLRNAPANLHVALAARPTSALMSSGILNASTVTRLTASDLRFRLDETMTVLSAALGSRCNPEAGVSLHELTEGWPLGVQLAAATAHRSGNMEELLSSGTADIRRYFIDSLIDRQPTEAVHLLVRLAHFDLIHPELCSAVLGGEEMVQHLHRLQDETPLLLQAEDSDWMRFHPLAREVLHERLIQLPEVERQNMAKRASNWYVAHELYEEAAEQSFLAGDMDAAVSLIERNIHQMMVQGRSNAILAWYQRLSLDEIKQYPGLLAPVAWVLAMSERHDLARPLINLILANPDISSTDRFEADLINATVAGYTDRVDLMAEQLTKWPNPPSQARIDEVPIHWIVKGFVALYSGNPDQARLDFSRIADFDRARAYSPMSYGFADCGTGLSYLWEGRYALAEQELRPALVRAEEHMDRRNPVACMLAALLAEACWERGQDDNPVALMAGRLVILERHGLPDALMSAYKVLARVADSKGRQDQALNLLESLQAIGQSRAILRLQVMAQSELVRLHARRGRGDTAQVLSAQLDVLINTRRAQIPTQFSCWMELRSELARAHASLANEDMPGALQCAELAISLAVKLKRGGDSVEASLIRAEVLQRQGSIDARTVQDEAISLAMAGGMVRLAREHITGQREVLVGPKHSNDEEGDEDVLGALKEPLVLGAGLLTLKEREVLTLLSRSLSNREIARAMDIGEQTVKWHIKNLFSKLDAGSRKHVVARARMLGLARMT
ncbi:LuxR C-terminal-related transcriptional regulator [Pseudomonas sp. N-137]|uniref:LuxR C-terminal-related transcriptional regulator n=1 Tax=Pseudomonas sp. N-137 TaxID=3108452 RepID=UPI002ADEBD36|nr:LuxR C-terminal-related transcriptional regulator [Pseudomonas sp. N-137]MEA1028084.1 LuxR C-terminal-related transcriptional regulator [Pseudomonas sp. N-137]